MNNLNKLHIVILDFDDIRNPLLNAGQARATFEVGKRLVKKGHKLTVISSRFPHFQNRIEEGIEYKHVGLGTKNIKLNNIAYILTLPFIVSRIKADIIVECFTPPISTLFSPLFTKIPVVGLPTMFSAGQFAKKYYFPFELVEKFGCRFYKYFLPYTEFFDQKMKKINPQVTSKIVPEGVGEEYFEIKKKKAKHILFLGRFDIAQKGLDLLLQAFQKSAKDISYPLVIAGKGPDEEKIKTMIAKLDLQDRVKIVGPAYGKKKFKLLSESLFVALPSRHEGFSLFALEALASGLPLATFDIPGLSWATNKVALKAKTFDVSDYAQILKKISNNKLLLQMGKNARNLAKQYTWENVTNQFEKFFQEVLDTEKTLIKKNAELYKQFSSKEPWQNSTVQMNNLKT